MAKAKAREYRELGEDALKTKVKDLEAGIFNMRFQASMGKLENTSQIRAARREVALAKTILNQKAKPARPAKAKA
jgi:large subunit ribosomal protein L29